MREEAPGVAKQHDPNYLKRLEKGIYWQGVIERYFRSFGLPVEKPKEEVLYARDDRGEKIRKTLWDLRVGGLLVEVRAIDCECVRRPNPRWPWTRVIATDVEGFDAKPVKPWADVHIATGSLYAFWVPQTYSAWWKEMIYDNERGRVRNFYCCDRSTLRPIGALVNAISDELGIWIPQADSNETDISEAVSP